MEDNLPKNLCEQCLTDLTYFYEFINKCRKSEEILQTTVKANAGNVIEIKVEEVDTPTESDFSIKTFTVKEESDVKPIKKRKIVKRIHHPSKPYCDLCDVLFKSFDEYREHKRNVKHPRSRNFECVHCQKRFCSSTHLVGHMRVHTKERPYACKLCSATFTHKCNLRRHARVHTHEKPYTCTVCSKCKYL